MLQKLANCLANWLLLGETVDDDEREIYIFSLELLLSTAASVITILIISLLTHQFWGTIVFLLCFLILRAYSGGFHAETYFKCYLVTVAIYIGPLFLTQMLPAGYHAPISLAMILISLVLVFRLAPREHANRPLSSEESVLFRVRSRMIILGFSLIGLGVTLLVPMLGFLAWWGTIGSFMASLMLLPS